MHRLTRYILIGILLTLTGLAAGCSDAPTNIPSSSPVPQTQGSPAAVVTKHENSLAIAQPLPNEAIGDRVTVRGQGIAYEGTIFVEVVAGDVTLGRALVTTEGEPDKLIHFMTEVVVAPATSAGEGEVVVYTTSPVDGSIDQRAAVPVKIEARSGGSPTSIYSAQPSIRINPTRGRAGTEVTVVGAGYPPGGEVQVRIGGLNSGTNPHVYATTHAGQHGNIQVSFVMPDRWPSGEAIVLPELLILVSTPDYAIKATAEFSYMVPGAP